MTCGDPCCRVEPVEFLTDDAAEMNYVVRHTL
jgi:hypothetical protein